MSPWPPAQPTATQELVVAQETAFSHGADAAAGSGTDVAVQVPFRRVSTKPRVLPFVEL